MGTKGRSLSSRGPGVEGRNNNTWHHIEPGATTVVVFVHGYFSNCNECWQSQTGTFWPDLLVSDPRVPRCSIFLGGYHTDLASGDYGVPECAHELMAALRRIGSDGCAPVLNGQSIIFVCHSLGGVVVRYMLDTYRDHFADKLLGVCLIASPSIGSAYARRLGPLASIFRNRSGKQLRLFNPFLQELDDRFVRFIESRSSEDFWGAEAIEHHYSGRIRLPCIPVVVPKHSAARYFGNRRVIPNTSHSTIAKPDSIAHPSHEFLVDFFAVQKSCCGLQENGRPLETSGPVPLDVLFDVYEARFEQMYVNRCLDEAIAEQARSRSVWLSGDSGMGKTCALKRYATRHVGSSFSVCFSQLGLDCDKDRILREFAETWSAFGSEVQPSHRGLLNFLTQASGEHVLVHVDEVDGDSVTGHKLLGLCGDLITTWKQSSQGRRLTFLISSLENPSPELLRRSAKLREMFSFEPSAAWSSEDMIRLSNMIMGCLPELSLQHGQLVALIDAAQGSPRFVKTFFRNLKFATTAPQSDFEMTLFRSSEQMRGQR